MRRPSRAPTPGWCSGLTIGLLLSDYMSRQVINAVFPLLKSEWSLADQQLGMLGGIVPLMVGIFTVPLSYLADRLGGCAASRSWRRSGASPPSPRRWRRA